MRRCSVLATLAIVGNSDPIGMVERPSTALAATMLPHKFLLSSRSSPWTALGTSTELWLRLISHWLLPMAKVLPVPASACRPCSLPWCSLGVGYDSTWRAEQASLLRQCLPTQTLTGIDRQQTQHTMSASRLVLALTSLPCSPPLQSSWSTLASEAWQATPLPSLPTRVQP